MEEAQAPEEVVLQPKALIALFDLEGQIAVEMRLPPGVEKIDEGSGAQMLMAWMATNWESLMAMFNSAYANYKPETEPESEEVKLLEPQTPKLVAADGKSLIQH